MKNVKQNKNNDKNKREQRLMLAHFYASPILIEFVKNLGTPESRKILKVFDKARSVPK